MRSPGDLRATGEPTVPVQVNSSPPSFIRESNCQHDNTRPGSCGDDDVNDNDGGDDSFADRAPTSDAPRNLIAQVVSLNQSDISPDYLGDMSDNGFTKSSQLGDTFPSTDGAAAHRILDQYFSKPAELGVFSVISALPVPVTSAYTATSGNSAHLPPGFLAMLLSIGMQLELTCTDHATRESQELLVDTLRIESIRRIPTLSWKSADINIYQCVALLLGSHTWCLKNELAGIAERWHAIAGMIWTDLRRGARRRQMLSDALIERYCNCGHNTSL